MKETIGVKGGRQDRRRQFKIKESKLKKIKELLEENKIKELEKEVKKKNIETAVKIAPLIGVAKVIEIVKDNKTNKKDQETIIFISDKTIKDNKQTLTKNEIKKVQEKKKEINNKINIIEDNIIEKNKKELLKFQDKKILEAYSKKFKSLRADIKEAAYEYLLIKEGIEKIHTSKEADLLLEKITYLIDKIEELKDKIEIKNINKYDDNYIYYLVDEYIKEFQNDKYVKGIKNSELYISLSRKVKELDNKKNTLNKNVEKKKAKFLIDEENMKKIREEYDKASTFNNKLLVFQSEQDALYKSLQEKIKYSVSIKDEVEIKLKIIDEEMKSKMEEFRREFLSASILSGKRITAITMMSMYFLEKVLFPKTEVKRYKVIKVKDYSRTIKESIDGINEVEIALSKTSKQLNSTIKKFKKNYSEYFGVIKECDTILGRLNSIEKSLKIKQEEISKIKKQQQKNLEKNNQKVKTLFNKRV